jgi:hypothetical protein
MTNNLKPTPTQPSTPFGPGRPFLVEFLPNWFSFVGCQMPAAGSKVEIFSESVASTGGVSRC